MERPDEKTVVSTLRSVILSSATPLRLQDVNSDYKMFIGSGIPFKELGYRNLEEFLHKLKDDGKISLQYENGNLMIHAESSSDSAHVTKLISKQKPPKRRSTRVSFRGRGGKPNSYGSRSSYRPPPPVRRPVYNSLRNGSQSWNDYLSPKKTYKPEYSINSRLSRASRNANIFSKEASRTHRLNNITNSSSYSSSRRVFYDDDYCEILEDDCQIIKEVLRPNKPNGISSSLPSNLQQRLGGKVNDENDLSRSNYIHEERHVYYDDKDRGDSHSRFSPPKKVDYLEKGSAAQGFPKKTNVQSNAVQNKSLPPRFQKKMEEKRSQDNVHSYQSNQRELPYNHLENSERTEKVSPVQNKSFTTNKSPAALVELARAKKQAEQVQRLAKTYLPLETSNSENSQHLNNFNGGDVNRLPLQNQSHPYLHSNSVGDSTQSTTPSNGQINAEFPMRSFQNQLPNLRIPDLSNLNLNVVSSPILSQASPPSLPPQRISPLIPLPVATNHAEHFPSQNSLNYLPLASNLNSQPNSLLLNNFQPPQQPQPSDFTRPLVSLSSRSATPAQDRLRKIPQPLNPNPMPPGPSVKAVQSNDDTRKLAPISNTQAHPISHPYSQELMPDQAETLSQTSDINGQLDSPCSYVEKLSLLCQKLKLPTPFYKDTSRFSKDAKSQLYYCTVALGPEKKFSSFPEESQTAAEAQEAAAKEAFSNITQSLITSNQKRLKNVRTADPFVLASRIAHLLESKPNGIWSTEIPKMYETNYKETLHDDWINLISNSEELSVTQVADRTIIRPVMTPTIKAPNFSSLPKLILPSDQTWYVYVTLAKSTTELWVRLIGEDYSDKYGELADDMDLSFMDAKPEDCSTSLKVGNYYAAKLEEGWIRVQLVSLKDNTCECFLIDNGDTDTFQKNELFDIDPLFLRLPAQAIKCCLYGLEKYADDPASVAYLNLILGKSYVAVVKSTKEPYSISLYDTSSDENIHMGEELLQEFNARNSTPVLPPVGSIQHGSKTYISHVTETGDVFLQIHSNHFEMLQNLLDNITEEEEKASMVTNIKEIELECKLYLAKFIDDQWYRAYVTHIHSETEIDVYFLDYGNTHTVCMNELLNLDKMSNLLSLIAPQAIMVHLSSLPPSVFSEKMAEKIRTLVPENDEVLVKTLSEDETPKVEIFKRVQPSNILASINNTILVDPEFSEDLKKAVACERTTSKAASEKKKDISKVIEETEVENSSSISSENTVNNTPSETSNVFEENSLSSLINKLNTNLKLDAEPFIPKGPTGTPSLNGTSTTEVTKKKVTFADIEKPAKVTDADLSIPSDLSPFEMPETDDKSLIPVKIVNAAHPDNFFIQTKRSSDTLKILMSDMNTFYNNHGKKMKKGEVTKGHTYAVQCKDQNWYRFTVAEISPEFCIGNFPDVGGFQMFNSIEICPLLPLFRKRPILATKAKLAGVKPKCKDWDMNDILQFQSMVENKELHCLVIDRQDSSLKVELFESDNAKNGIASELISIKCASKSD